MALNYSGIQWNRQKRIYDLTLAALVIATLGVFLAVNAILRPNATAETLILRSTSLTAILLLHLVLCIGPLARLDTRFLPFLYNRRHLGVTVFFLAFVHATLAVFQFHALGPVNPFVSVFTAYQRDYDPFIRQSANIAQFPFEPFGVLALAILFLMAATSHDFWLRNLGASFWKILHIFVYVAYAAVILHVAFGILQSEQNPVYVILLLTGALVILGLHLIAGFREAKRDQQAASLELNGYVEACDVADLTEGRGKTVSIGAKRLAVFLHEGKVHALSNTCRHQGGPIGEGQIRDGCITCPWHGWQYRPEDGKSPPPFNERVPTYPVRIHEGRVYIHPDAQTPGTPAQNSAEAKAEKLP